MMKKGLFTVLLVMLLALVGCGGDEGTTEGKDTSKAVEQDKAATSEADPGEELYKQKCANCHGGNLEGAVGGALTDSGTKYTEEELVDIIVNGIEKTTMPGGLLQGDDAAAVAKWLVAQSK